MIDALEEIRRDVSRGALRDVGDLEAQGFEAGEATFIKNFIRSV